jgi:hypothetical protein
MSTDGAKMSKVERALSGVFGALGITVFAGWLNRARKAGKIGKIMQLVPLMKKYLPGKLADHKLLGGKISNQTQVLIRPFLESD